MKEEELEDGKQGDSRVEGTLDVVGGLLDVRLLGVGLGSSSDLVGEGLSALAEGQSWFLQVEGRKGSLGRGDGWR